MNNLNGAGDGVINKDGTVDVDTASDYLSSEPSDDMSSSSSESSSEESSEIRGGRRRHRRI